MVLIVSKFGPKIKGAISLKSALQSDGFGNSRTCRNLTKRGGNIYLVNAVQFDSGFTSSPGKSISVAVATRNGNNFVCKTPLGTLRRRRVSCRTLASRSQSLARTISASVWHTKIGKSHFRSCFSGGQLRRFRRSVRSPVSTVIGHCGE